MVVADAVSSENSKRERVRQQIKRRLHELASANEARDGKLDPMDFLESQDELQADWPKSKQNLPLRKVEPQEGMY